MGKVKVVLEMEVKEGFFKYIIDNVICTALQEEGATNVRIISPYTDEKWHPITSDFFIRDDEVEDKVKDVLRKEGCLEKEIEVLLEKADFFPLFYQKWSSGNVVGKEKECFEKAVKETRDYICNISV